MTFLWWSTALARLICRLNFEPQAVGDGTLDGTSAANSLAARSLRKENVAFISRERECAGKNVISSPGLLAQCAAAA